MLILDFRYRGVVVIQGKYTKKCCHCALSPLSLTHSLTHSLLFSRLDWCDPGVWRCQLVEVVTVADVGAEIRVDDSLVLNLEAEVWSENFCSYFEHKVWSRFWGWSSAEILKLKYWRIEAGNRSRFVYELMWPKEVILVSRSQPSGPLSLWQCYISANMLLFMQAFNDFLSIIAMQCIALYWNKY